MKTSNKLLIGFASTLVLIPVLGIAIISRVFYEDLDNFAIEIAENDTFKSASKNMVTQAVSEPFQSVSITGVNDLYLTVRLVSDENSGIKFTKNFKGLISAKVDSKGYLQIVLEKSDKQQENYANIWIYSASVKRLRVKNGRGMNLDAKLDSLQLELSQLGSASFGANTKIGWLSVHTEDVNVISFNDAATRSVNLALNGTNLKSEKSSFENLSINAMGNSEIELNGGYDEKTSKVIGNLTLNTHGKGKVRISNMQVNQSSGKFSDSTQVEMPALTIKQMFNSK